MPFRNNSSNLPVWRSDFLEQIRLAGQQNRPVLLYNIAKVKVVLQIFPICEIIVPICESGKAGNLR
jgi:hypothetical protein